MYKSSFNTNNGDNVKEKAVNKNKTKMIKSPFGRKACARVTLSCHPRGKIDFP